MEDQLIDEIRRHLAKHFIDKNETENENEKSVFSKVVKLSYGRQLNVNLVLSVTNNSKDHCSKDQMFSRTKESEKLDPNIKSEKSVLQSKSLSTVMKESELDNKERETKTKIKTKRSFQHQQQQQQSPLLSPDKRRKEEDLSFNLGDADTDNEVKRKQEKIETSTKSQTSKNQNCEEKDRQKDETSPTFNCNQCLSVFPMSTDEDVEQICSHIAVGVAGSSASNFSEFFRFFRFRVKLIVKPTVSSTSVGRICRPQVSTETVVSCLKCPNVEFPIDENVGSNLSSHLKTCCERNGVIVSPNFCVFCDRRVANVEKHSRESADVHFKRLKAMSTCSCIEKQSCQKTNSCKMCRHNIQNPDQRLPEWLSTNYCDGCIVDIAQTVDAKSTKPEVVFCTFCRQGKFGHSIRQTEESSKLTCTSICVNCLDIFEAFSRMKNQMECFNYVKGMLNELVSASYYFCLKSIIPFFCTRPQIQFFVDLLSSRVIVFFQSKFSFKINI